MISRRETLSGGALTLLFLGGFTCPCQAVQLSKNTQGCLLARNDLGEIKSRATNDPAPVNTDESVIWKSGDKLFDYALAHSLAKIAGAFEILPGFAYYDDGEHLNAYATPAKSLRSDSDGSVFFGLNFLKKLRALPESPEVAAVTVCAHEFGHIVQYKHSLIETVNAGQPTVKRCELQADYFAGYFTGLRKRELSSYPAAVAAFAQFTVGDTQFADRGHHGIPEERGAAVVRGFEAAFREQKSLATAIEESTRYVLTL
jgi:hypothetical protein